MLKLENVILFKHNLKIRFIDKKSGIFINIETLFEKYRRL
jgi:hypothetical protein